MTVASKNCGSQGALTTMLAVDSGTAFNASSKRYDFVVEDVGLVEWVVGGRGLTGRLDMSANHIRRGPGYVRGRVMMNISPKELDWWLPYITTATKSLNTFTPSNEDNKVDLMFKRDQATFVYTECYINSWMLRASTSNNEEEPQLVDCVFEFFGKDEQSGTFPSPAPAIPNTNVLYWLTGDSSLTINSVSYPFIGFNFMYSNNLEVLMRNSLRPTCIRSRYRSVHFQPRLPLSDESAPNLHFSTIDAGGIVSFISDTNIGDSLSETTLDMNRLIGPRRTPRTRGRVETPHDLDLISYAGTDETTDPCVLVTNRFPP